MTEAQWHRGGCHCGAVRFEVALVEPVEAQTCNCSMCAKVGFIHMIVPESRFRLVQGGQSLTEYVFNTCVAKHFFARFAGLNPSIVRGPTPTGGR